MAIHLLDIDVSAEGCRVCEGEARTVFGCDGTEDVANLPTGTLKDYGYPSHKVAPWSLAILANKDSYYFNGTAWNKMG